MNSAIIWQGKSPLDNAPIMAVVTGLSGNSANSKTGGMIQLWVLREDLHPTEALRTGEDYSICGDCPHRPKIKGADALKKTSRTCYVNVMAPNAIYKVYKDGKLPKIAANFAVDLIDRRPIRLGAYGDPALLPLELLRELTKFSASTGYTHQWRECDPRYSEFLMASADTPADVITATAKGWRVFYADRDPAPIIGGRKLAICPASKEAGRRTTCLNCLACGGNRTQPGEFRPRQSLISIRLH
jgi:hypothetical protein